MREATSYQTIYISSRHPALDVGLTLSLETPGSQIHPVEIQMNLDLLPDRVRAEILLCRINKGIHTETTENNPSLEKGNIQIQLKKLFLSDELDSYSEDEIKILAIKLEKITREVRDSMIRSMSRGIYC